MYTDKLLRRCDSPVQKLHSAFKETPNIEYKHTFAGVLEEELLKKNDRGVLLKWLNIRGNITNAMKRKPLEAKELSGYVRWLDNFLYELFDCDSLDDPKK